jgi:hypothetical protein
MTDRPNSEDAHRVPGKLESDPEDDERLLADNRSDDAVGPSDAPVAEDPAMSTHGPTEESSDPLVSHRHPTGEPELTGGWMSDSELNVQPPNLGTSAPPPEPSAGEKLDPNETPKRPFPEEVEAAPGLTAATEDDIDATRVSPSAITSMIPDEPTASSSRERLQGCGSCMIRMAILGLFVFLAGVIGVVSFGLYQYYALVATLPSVTDLEEHVSQFETTRILDREGNLLYELLDPQAGRRTYVPLTEVSPYMIAAILATEDSQFYSHPGFDPMAIGRAVWHAISFSTQRSVRELPPGGRPVRSSWQQRSPAGTRRKKSSNSISMRVISGISPMVWRLLPRRISTPPLTS